MMSVLVLLSSCSDDTSSDEENETTQSDPAFNGRLMIYDSDHLSVRVYDLEEEDEIAHYHLPSGSDEVGFGVIMNASPNGRYGFALLRTDHPVPANEPDRNQVMVFDSGLGVENHGDHYLATRGSAAKLPFSFGHGGDQGQSDYYRPIHWVGHHDLMAIHFDGSSDESDSSENKSARVLVYDQNDMSGSAPPAVFDFDLGTYQHGVAVPWDEDLFIISTGVDLSQTSLPNGVSTYDGSGAQLQNFEDMCPLLHGESSTGNFIAFGCNQSDPERYGLLVLEYNPLNGNFAAIKVNYPNDATTNTTGTIYGGHGSSEGYFAGSYSDSEMILINTAEIEDDTSNGVYTFSVAGTRSSFGFEPADDNFANSDGRLLVLTKEGDLLIYDVADIQSDPITISGAVEDFNECTANCPTLRLGPGVAYVSNPEAGEITEINTELAEVSRRLAVNGTTASFAIMGWFNFDAPIEYNEH